MRQRLARARSGNASHDAPHRCGRSETFSRATSRSIGIELAWEFLAAVEVAPILISSDKSDGVEISPALQDLVDRPHLRPAAKSRPCSAGGRPEPGTLESHRISAESGKQSTQFTPIARRCEWNCQAGSHSCSLS